MTKKITYENIEYDISPGDINPGDYYRMKFTKKRPWYLGGTRKVDCVLQASGGDWDMANDDPNCTRVIKHIETKHERRKRIIKEII